MKAFLVVLLGFSISLPALANRIAAKKDWVLDEVPAQGGSGKLCVATTSAKEGKSIYTLEVHKRSRQAGTPVELVMREIGEQQIGPVATANLSQDKVIFNAYAQSGNTKFFWYLPDEVANMLYHLKAGRELDLLPLYKSAIKDLDFSLKGASEILQIMERHCNFGQDLVDQRLASLTNHPDSFDLNPHALDPNVVSEMRNLYHSMAAQLLQVAGIEKEISDLVARYRPYITERDQLSAEKAQLTATTIPGIKNDQIATSQRLNRTQVRLGELKSQIPQAEKSLSQAQAGYDAAYAKIAPHMPKHNQLVAVLNQVSSDLDQAEAALASAVREFQNNESKMRGLDQEARDLSYRIDSIRRELSYARNEVEHARRNYNAYRPDVERRRLLDREPGYHQKRAEADRLRSQLTIAKTEYEQSKRDLDRARNILQRCQSVAGQDCSAEQQAANQAAQNMTQKSAAMNQIDSQYKTVHREVDRMEDRVDRIVRQEEQRLAGILNRAQSEYDRLSSNLHSAESRRHEIVNVELPRLQDRNRYLQSQKNSLNAEIARLERQVAAALRELNDFDARVGYKELERRLEAADSSLHKAKVLLSDLQSERSRLSSLEVQDQQRLVQLARDLQSAQSRLAQVDARIGTLNGVLAQYDVEKAGLDGRLRSANAQVSSLQSQYLAKIQ